MAGPRQRRLSGRRRLVLGLGVLCLTVLVLAAAGRLLAGAPGFLGSPTFWRLLGVRIQAPAEGSPARVEEVPSAAEPGSGGGPGVAGGAGAASGGGAAAGGGGATTKGSGLDVEERVAPGATLVWTVVYECCGFVETTPGPAPQGMTGLDQETLATELRDWEIVSFSPERVELRRAEREKMCPSHTKRTLRLEDGRLVLYAGSLEDPSVRLICIGPTEISEDDLSPAEAEILSVGKVFDSQDEVFRFIEGLED